MTLIAASSYKDIPVLIHEMAL